MVKIIKVVSGIFILSLVGGLAYSDEATEKQKLVDQVKKIDDGLKKAESPLAEPPCPSGTLEKASEKSTAESVFQIENDITSNKGKICRLNHPKWCFEQENTFFHPKPLKAGDRLYILRRSKTKEGLSLSLLVLDATKKEVPKKEEEITMYNSISQENVKPSPLWVTEPLTKLIEKDGKLFIASVFGVIEFNANGEKIKQAEDTENSLRDLGFKKEADAVKLVYSFEKDSSHIGNKWSGTVFEDPENRVLSLMVFLGHRYSNVRYFGASILAKSKLESKSVGQVLERSLIDDSDSRVRAAAALALGRMGVYAKLAVPALIEKGLEDESADVKSSSVHALGEIGPDAKEAIPKLEELKERLGPLKDSMDVKQQQLIHAINGALAKINKK